MGLGGLGWIGWIGWVGMRLSRGKEEGCVHCALTALECGVTATTGDWNGSVCLSSVCDHCGLCCCLWSVEPDSQNAAPTLREGSGLSVT
jgi:hypothetical protein